MEKPSEKRLLKLVNLILISGILGTCFSYKFDWFTKTQNTNVEIMDATKDVSTSAYIKEN